MVSKAAASGCLCPGLHLTSKGYICRRTCRRSMRRAYPRFPAVSQGLQDRGRCRLRRLLCVRPLPNPGRPKCAILVHEGQGTRMRELCRSNCSRQFSASVYLDVDRLTRPRIYCNCGCSRLAFRHRDLDTHHPAPALHPPSLHAKAPARNRGCLVCVLF